jgi:hypothetical protein
MTMFDSEVTATIAFAEVTGANPPTFVINRGFSAISRTGAGDYTLTLETNEGQSDANMQAYITVVGATPMITAVEHASATTLRVRGVTHDNMAAEFSFNLEVHRPTNTFA